MTTNTDVAVYVEYQPDHVTLNNHGSILPKAIGNERLKQNLYENVDALFHYFDDLDTEGYADENPEETHAEVAAKLIAGKYSTDLRVLNSVQRHVEPSYQWFRDSTTFISGMMINDRVDQIARWLVYHNRDQAIVLDASRYETDFVKGETIPAFNRMMDIANNQRDIIEQGVIDMFPNSSRDAIRFINASQGEEITDSKYNDTKWLAEGRILANKLLTIETFRDNYNMIIIKNATRWIHANRLNLNNLYRLMAKLGRINTQLIFVG